MGGCGRNLPVQVASLGAVPKDPSCEEVGVVHDGTHGIKVSTEIRQPNKTSLRKESFRPSTMFCPK